MTDFLTTGFEVFTSCGSGSYSKGEQAKALKDWEMIQLASQNVAFVQLVPHFFTVGLFIGLSRLPSSTIVNPRAVVVHLQNAGA